VKRRPAEPVDVVAVDAGPQQAADDARWPRSAARMRPVPLKLSLSSTRAFAEGELEQARVVAHLAGGDQVGALDGFVLGVDVCALTDQGARQE
jgi:hypothetical protein